MNDIDANPTRMELLNVNAKLSLARRGHDMLKKKRDTLISEEIAARKELSEFRGEVYSLLGEAYRDSKLVEMEMGSVSYGGMAFNKSGKIAVNIDYKKVVGVRVPVGSAEVGEEIGGGYSFIGTPAGLDDVVLKFRNLSLMAARLAALDAKVHVLGDDIRRTRRKVNALEKVKIKNLESADKYIRGYLDEMEREDYSRLKHIKEIVKGDDE